MPFVEVFSIGAVFSRFSKGERVGGRGGTHVMGMKVVVMACPSTWIDAKATNRNRVVHL